MYLFWILLLVYLLIFALILAFYWTCQIKNFWRRVLIDNRPCPFGKLQYRIMEEIGERQDSEGVFSYCLYGNYQRYTPNLIYSLDVIKERCPTWQARVYAGPDIPIEIKRTILHKGAHLVIMGPSPPLGHEAALWRFLPLREKKSFLSLDADDRLSEKFITAKDRWLKSGQPFCTLCPGTFFLPFTAGTWGARGGLVPDIQERIEKYCEHWYGFDEAFLRQEIWPIAKKVGCWYSETQPYDTWLAALIVFIIGLAIYTLYLALCC